ncbi:ABC transporter ATP-binding protein [Microbacterium sp. HA-8]|uniref:ABC transporter ATP-binding protein n=1 Tax=Microbacterium sp. HA-8 TaxID=3234200 RepID=UPI0038F6A0D7
MSWVTVDGLRVNYGSQTVLDGVDLQIPHGGIVAVLGPSGCGKTTLLRSIAGLLPVAGGSIRVGDRELSTATRRIAPEKRGIGWVPQDASLFPHLSVGDNIGFGLPKGRARTERIAELAELVGLADHIGRAPSQLSGGQAQRVSLARALAPRPDVVLLDEPFAALDPMLRTALRAEVAELLRSQDSTALLVTHDQEEALSLADHIAVMMGGRILQWGSPVEVYERPATPWVARFVGDTVEFSGYWREGEAQCALGGLDAVLLDGGISDGDGVRIVLRPEWLTVHLDGANATVISIGYAGHDALVTLELDGGARVRSRLAAPDLPEPGDRVRVSVRRPALAYL